MQSIRTDNQHFYYSFHKRSHTTPNASLHHLNFKTTTFTPFVIQKSALLHKESQADRLGLLGRFAQRFTYFSKSASTLSKWVLCVGAMSLFILPVKGFLTPTTPQSISTLEKVINEGKMTIATTKSDSTVFHHEDLLHGFGHDVAYRYADKLGVTLNLKVYDTEQEALNALTSGQVDGFLGSSTTHAGARLVCDDGMAQTVGGYGLDTQISLIFGADDGTMMKHANAFFCDTNEMALTTSLARFYDQTLLDNEYSDKHFKRAISQRLPLYKHAFLQGAKAHNHDWRVLAAISYQESHLDPNAISRTGVEGLMMLTQDTAKEMGVVNRTDAIESIAGGAKYLEVLEKLYADVSESERLWFVLASYNMGPNAIKRIQSELNTKGRNGNSWAEVYGYLSQNASQNSRYVQCMHYVANIRTYLETIKTMEV
ncbi:MAG: transglycosylase SLT domain-containing protein [Moraxella sp.]|uniref:transglycosylase SLT domain-containing protein n=1 Tax=Moraxella sp. TaxID=479 RepID=UPI0026DA81FC|nr:transglycosylase SLT domain-containing protein [Moraxella sp.]MDO4449888.1 transglycosylase SLT domain-containing protein [Moraxella sp.]